MKHAGRLRWWHAPVALMYCRTVLAGIDLPDFVSPTTLAMGKTIHRFRTKGWYCNFSFNMPLAVFIIQCFHRWRVFDQQSSSHLGTRTYPTVLDMDTTTHYPPILSGYEHYLFPPTYPPWIRTLPLVTNLSILDTNTTTSYPPINSV